jgi:hypothetical protein
MPAEASCLAPFAEGRRDAAESSSFIATGSRARGVELAPPGGWHRPFTTSTFCATMTLARHVMLAIRRVPA